MCKFQLPRTGIDRLLSITSNISFKSSVFTAPPSGSFHTLLVISAGCIQFPSYSCNSLPCILFEKQYLFSFFQHVWLWLPIGGGEKHLGAFLGLSCSECCGILPSALSQETFFGAFTSRFCEGPRKSMEKSLQVGMDSLYICSPQGFYIIWLDHTWYLPFPHFEELNCVYWCLVAFIFVYKFPHALLGASFSLDFWLVVCLAMSASWWVQETLWIFKLSGLIFVVIEWVRAMPSPSFYILNIFNSAKIYWNF